MRPKRHPAGTVGGTRSTFVNPEGESRVGHTILPDVDHQFVDLAHFLVPAIDDRPGTSA